MKKFFYGVFQQLVSQFIVLSIALAALAVLLLMLVAGFALNKGDVVDRGFLVIPLSGKILESPNELDLISTLMEEIDDSYSSSPVLLDLIRSLRLASSDPNIKGVVLKGSDSMRPLSASYALLSELRRELVRFKESGKPIYAYSRTYSQKAYYLASVADELVMHPSGSLELKGLGVEQLYFADALKRNGIRVQVARAGKYKSAVEPFFRDDMSLEQLEQLNRLLSTLWGEFRKDISNSRNIGFDRIQFLSDEYSLLSSEVSLEEDLVDHCDYIDILDRWARSIGPASHWKDFSVSLSDYKLMNLDRFYNQKNQDKSIAVVYVDGNIVDGEGDSDQAGSSRILKSLKRLEKEDDLAGIVVRINSPGGSALASEVVHHKLMELKEDYPVVVSMGGMAASGGYWIASASDYIFSESMTITGSIGVWSLIPSIGDFAKQYGVSVQSVYTSKNAGLMSLLKTRSESGMSIVQAHVDAVYKDFTARVSVSREMDEEQVQEVSGGRVWTGYDALAKNLVDEHGGLTDAIRKVASLADIPAYRLLEYPSSNPSENLLNALGVDEAFQPELGPMESLLEPFISECDMMANSLNTVQARLPYFLRIE